MENELKKFDVVVLCGGLGSRLRAVVNDLPKPMAAIGNKPFLKMLIDHLKTKGFSRFILCSGYKSEAIESFFGESCQGADIVFSVEEKPMGTGGALWNARRLIKSDPFIVLNGDSFCGVDYEEIISYHCSKKADITLALAFVDDASDYGTVKLEQNGIISSFLEKTGEKEKGLINAGIYVFSKHIFDSVSLPAPFSLERDIFPYVCSNLKLYGWRTDSMVIDIGTPERYFDAQKRLQKLMN